MASGSLTVLLATALVTAADGRLVGYGQGAPPHWCKTAAAAEAWALYTVVGQTAFIPAMRTDCLSLIATAAAGVIKATDPRKVLARIWVLLAAALDGELQMLADHRALIWIPAHTSPASIGEIKRSDGMRLSHVDWRANRLADALAKQAAAGMQPPRAVSRLLTSAMHAARHAAKLLGRVTFAANNHKVQIVGEDGHSISRTVRDSVDAPRKTRVAPRPRAAAKAKDAVKVHRQVHPWQAPRQMQTASRRRHSHPPATRAAVAAVLQGRVDDIGASLRAPVGRATGADRLQALRDRVRQREASTEL
jgi:hypothetical protein